MKAGDGSPITETRLCLAKPYESSVQKLYHIKNYTVLKIIQY